MFPVLFCRCARSISFSRVWFICVLIANPVQEMSERAFKRGRSPDLEQQQQSQPSPAEDTLVSLSHVPIPFHILRLSLTVTPRVLTALAEIARVLGCDLPRDALALCVQLCEAGVSPDALAAVVRDVQSAARPAPIGPVLPL